MLVIGDLHLHDKFPGYIDAQIKFIRRLIEEGRSADDEEVIFLGDVFHKRKPSPTEILAFKNILSVYGFYHVIVGNHDRETKSYESETILSIFETEDSISGYVSVYVEPGILVDSDIFANIIPHYEDEKYILKALEDTPKETDITFGHFGYKGQYNSIGTLDSRIPLSKFKGPTMLGHIHSASISHDGKVVVVGTPYHTSFAEQGKQNYYGIVKKFESNLDNWVQMDLEKIEGGPTFIYSTIEELPQHKSKFEDPNFYTVVRLTVDFTKSKDIRSLRKNILEKYDIDHLEIKLKIPTLPKHQSDLKVKDSVFDLEGGIIEDYLTAQTTDLDEASLRAGLALLEKEV